MHRQDGSVALSANREPSFGGVSKADDSPHAQKENKQDKPGFDNRKTHQMTYGRQTDPGWAFQVIPRNHNPNNLAFGWASSTRNSMHYSAQRHRCMYTYHGVIQ